MSRNVNRPLAKPESGHFRNRNQIVRNRNQISPVMQKVRELLPPAKAAHHLHILTNLPLSTCQKALSGHGAENLEMVTALLRSELGREVLFALMGDARPDWFSKYRKQLDVNAARRQLAEAQRRIDALQKEALE